MNPKRAREEQKQAGGQAPDDQPPKLPPEGIFSFCGYVETHRSGKPITERLRYGKDCLFLLRGFWRASAFPQIYKIGSEHLERPSVHKMDRTSRNHKPANADERKQDRDRSMAPDTKPQAQPAALQEGLDYYLENGLFVFTAAFLLRRDYCCDSGCRHCPYQNQ